MTPRFFGFGLWTPPRQTTVLGLAWAEAPAHNLEIDLLYLFKIANDAIVS